MGHGRNSCILRVTFGGARLDVELCLQLGGGGDIKVHGSVFVVGDRVIPRGSGFVVGD